MSVIHLVLYICFVIGSLSTQEERRYSALPVHVKCHHNLYILHEINFWELLGPP